MEVLQGIPDDFHTRCFAVGLIEASAVWKEFPQPGESVVALRDVNLTIERGDFLLITGESGSGKSTLLSILGTLDRPTRGEVRFMGEALESLPSKRLDAIRSRHIGFVFQDFRLVRHLSAIDNVRLPQLLSGESPVSDRARSLIDKFKVSHRCRHKPDTLSRGEMQRIALARALINRPEAVFADEPTANLDRTNAGIIWHHLRQLHHDEDLTVVVATHNLDLAETGDRVIRLDDGRVASDEKHS
jgi:ABC-type lipoprotein export system ATPase subunit